VLLRREHNVNKESNLLNPYHITVLLSIIDLVSQYPLINYPDLSTSDDVTSLITDEDNTLVDEPSAMEDSLIASEELQSALMLYNDSFPVGQETVIENGKKYIPF
jgi:hypothetical protein